MHKYQSQYDAVSFSRWCCCYYGHTFLINVNSGYISIYRQLKGEKRLQIIHPLPKYDCIDRYDQTILKVASRVSSCHASCYF